MAAPLFQQVAHLNRRSLPKRRRSLAHRIRLAAKQQADSHINESKDLCEIIGLPCMHSDNFLGTTTTGIQAGKLSHAKSTIHERRNHLEKDLRLYQRLNDLHNVKGASSSSLKSSKFRNSTTGDGDDVGLAHSSVPLPSDRNRLQRQPSLGREDAFCDATTFKNKGKVQVQSVPYAASTDDAQIAHLYQLGLLYEDGEPSQADLEFGFNNIHHDEPAYTVRFSKRGRKSGKSRRSSEPLHLSLSFTDLGTDNDLAEYINTSASFVDESSRPSAPLRIIYELNGDAGPSFDVDTSQPPDLVTDMLSDYDCFSESDLDDVGPSQQEVEATDETSTTWILLGNEL